MDAMLPDRRAEVLRDRIENRPSLQAKAHLKKIAAPWKVRVGLAIDSAISMAGLTQKEVWVLLGHSNGAQLNRWIAATERPQFDVLFAVSQLQRPLVIALARLASDGIEIVTEIRLKESA